MSFREEHVTGIHMHHHSGSGIDHLWLRSDGDVRFLVLKCSAATAIFCQFVKKTTEGGVILMRKIVRLLSCTDLSGTAAVHWNLFRHKRLYFSSQCKIKMSGTSSISDIVVR